MTFKLPSSHAHKTLNPQCLRHGPTCMVRHPHPLQPHLTTHKHIHRAAPEDPSELKPIYRFSCAMDVSSGCCHSYERTFALCTH